MEWRVIDHFKHKQTVYMAVLEFTKLDAAHDVYLVLASERNLEDPASDVLGVNVPIGDGRSGVPHLDCYWQDRPWFGCGMRTNFNYDLRRCDRSHSYQFVLVDRATPVELIKDYYLQGNMAAATNSCQCITLDLDIDIALEMGWEDAS